MKDDSYCPKRKLCNFVVSRDLPEVQIEVCMFCSKKVIYSKDSRGRVDKQKYLRDHIRDTVQPYGKTRNQFFKIYGEDAYREFIRMSEGRKSKRQLDNEWDDIRKDIVRTSTRQRIYR